jgi:glycosyltransferase involved in cell wall biosynthesis
MSPPRPMRVLVVHNRYRSSAESGENRAVEREIELLREGGCTVVRYVRDSDDIARFGVRDLVALPARVVWSEDDRRSLMRLVARARPDIVHVHNTFPLISPSSIHAVAALGIPSVVTVHNYRLFCANGLLFRDGRPCEDCLGSSPFPGVVHACYRGSRLATVPIALNISGHRRIGTWERVSAFVALSEFARAKMIAGGIPAERISIKPNFAPAPQHPRVGAGSHLLFMGRLSPEKGADLLVSAWSSDLGSMLVAGEGPSRRDLESSAVMHGSSVRFLGHRTPDQCITLLRSARALVVPSRAYEGFPVVLVEAFAHGVPVIAPDHGPFPEIVEHGVTGLLFRPGDADSLADRMRELSDPTRSQEMGVAARSTYEARYTPERNFDTLMRIYERATSVASGEPTSTGGPRASASRSGADR